MSCRGGRHPHTAADALFVKPYEKYYNKSCRADEICFKIRAGRGEKTDEAVTG